MALAVAMVACQGATPKEKTPVVLGGMTLSDMSFSNFVAGTDTAAARTVTLTSSHFRGTNLKYTATSSKPSVATATVSGSTVTVTPKGAGNATVTVIATATADDEEGTQSLSFTVTVTGPEEPPANNPPTVRTISSVSLEVAETEPITLSEYFTDPEGDDLTYTADSSNVAIATVSEPDTNSMITITAVAAGRTTISITANDGTNVAVSQTFRVTVTDASIPDNNQPYRTAPLPNLTGLKVDVSPDPIDLSNHFEDDEDDELEYSASPVDAGVVTVEVSGSILTITVVAPGTTTINVNVADDANNQVRGSFDVMVVNQAPMIVTDEATRFGPYMPGDTQKITVSEYFTDAEGDSLTYTADSDDGTIATVTNPDADSIITITAAAVGTAMITITANDGTSITSHTLTVTVSAVPNMAPEVVGAGIPNQSLKLVVDEATMTESATTTLDLMGHFNDPDGLPEPLSYSTDSEMATVAGSMLTITASVPGTTMITVTASDGADQISGTFDVVVASPEAPETSSELPDQNFDHDDMAARTFMLSSYFMRATSYAHEITGEANVVTAEVAGGVLTLTPAGSSGRAVVEVTPSNSGGDGSSQTITVIVDPTPVPTSIKPLQAVTTQTDAGPTAILLSDYFSDATSYEVGSNNEAALRATEADGTLTLTPDSHGMATVTVTPINSGGRGTAQTFDVTVQTKPTLKSGMMFDDLRLAVPADPTATGALESLDLNEYFEDLDGTIEKYSTTTTDAEKLAVFATRPTGTDDEISDALDDADMEDSAEVMLEARAAGTVKVTVTVTDDDGLDRTETFDVTVVTVNAAPIVTTTPAAAPTLPIYSGDTRLKRGDTPKKPINDAAINLHFTDTDLNSNAGDLLTFSVKYVATGGDTAAADLDDDDVVATAIVSPDTWDGDRGGEDKFTVTVTPKKAGAAHDILIVATDLAGDMIHRTIMVQVNQPPLAEGDLPDDADDDAKPMKLSEYTDAEGIAAGAADGSDDITITLVAEDGGYFHDDDDGDTLTCTAVPSRTGDTAPAVVKMNATETAFTLDLVNAYTTDLRPMDVTVRCRDNWGTGADAVVGEWSPTQTFTVSVTHPGPEGSSR